MNQSGVIFSDAQTAMRYQTTRLIIIISIKQRWRTRVLLLYPKGITKKTLLCIEAELGQP